MAAARNTAADSKRFVFRSPNKDPDAYFIPANQSGSYVSSRTAQSTDMTTPHTEA
ncbi:unnamed protein product, partial [Rotaria socialis]